MKSPIKLAITGPTGQMGYALVFLFALTQHNPVSSVWSAGGAGKFVPRLVSGVHPGAILGRAQAVALDMIEIPAGFEALKGVVMELDDCAFPVLKNMVATTDLDEG